MADGKKGIIVYADWIDKFELLEDAEAGKLIKHFFRFVNDLNPVAPDRITELSFIDIQKSLQRDLVKWENAAERSRLNGKLGGRPSKEKPTITQQVISEPKKPVNVNVNVNDNVNVNVTERVKEGFTLADEKPKDFFSLKTEESEKGMPPPENPLLNSNLYRQPNTPTRNEVREFFIRSGGNDQMAECFFEKNQSVGWFLRGSPIMNFRNLVPSFINNWNKNEQNARNTGNNAGAKAKITGASAGLNVINQVREELLRSRN